MTLDHDACYQVFKARDARFDGQLFVGVSSTGIYCRPICRVRTPRQENCRFFGSAAQAEAADFRPCLKCRPEVAPGPGLAWSVMEASRTLAHQAARWLDARLGEDESPSIATLAAHLGVSDRHLRRIFVAEHGVTPLQYLQTRRLLLAKQLLTDTRVPVAEVAWASGFRSQRRFNAAFQQAYRMSPSRLRHDTADDQASPADTALSVSLGYRPPYDTDAMLRFLALRAIPGVEQVDGSRVRRSLRAGALAPVAGWLEADFIAATPTRAAHVQLQFAPTLAAHSAQVIAGVRRWLDLDAAPATIDAALADLPGAPGLRLPGSVDAFEMMVRAVLGQQVTVAAARTLARRLVDRFGDEAPSPWPDITRRFPAPERLAAAALSEMAELGIIQARVHAIQSLARAWPEIAAALQTTTAPDRLVAQLDALPGIGPWTAHYIVMRTLGWPDAFPPNDIAVRNALSRQHGNVPVTAREAERLAERWRPWRAYAVLRLWNTLA